MLVVLTMSETGTAFWTPTAAAAEGVQQESLLCAGVGALKEGDPAASAAGLLEVVSCLRCCRHCRVLSVSQEGAECSLSFACETAAFDD